MTFEYLFGRVLELCSESSKSKINQIVYWKVDTDENIIKALLTNNIDLTAITYTHLYIKDVNHDLLIF